MKRTELQLELRRLAQLAAGVLGASLAGSAYAFGLVSDALKSKFGFTQGSMTTITTIGFSCAFLSIIWGLMLDRFGPRILNASSAALMAVGFVLFGLSFDRVLPASVAFFAIAYSATMLPMAAPDTGCIMATTFCFPHDRGAVVTVQKTFMGLGSTAFASVYSGFFNEQSESKYLYTVAAIVACVGCVTTATAFFGHPTTGAKTNADDGDDQNDLNSQSDERQDDLNPDALGNQHERSHLCENVTHGEDSVESQASKDPIAEVYEYFGSARPPPWVFQTAFVLLAVNFGIAFASACVDAFAPPSHAVRRAFVGLTLVGMLSFWALPVAFLVIHLRRSNAESRPLPLGEKYDAGSPSSRASSSVVAALLHQSHVHHHERNDVNEHEFVDGAEDVSFAGVHAIPYTSSLLGTIRSMNPLWVLCALYGTALQGAGATLVTNSAQVYRSANDGVEDTRINTLCVSCIGLGMAAGRVVPGMFERFYPQASVTLLLAPIALTAAAGCALLLVLPASAFPIGFFVHATAYGACYAAVLLMARMSFVNGPGAHYASVFFGGAVSFPMVNRGVFGEWFDAVAQQSPSVSSLPLPAHHNGRVKDTDVHCAGRDCTVWPLALFVALNLLAAVAGALAHRYWMRRCSRR